LIGEHAGPSARLTTIDCYPLHSDQQEIADLGGPTRLTNGEAADAGHYAFKYKSDWAPATFRWLETKLSADPTHE
jgi:hypothetical protein